MVFIGLDNAYDKYLERLCSQFLKVKEFLLSILRCDWGYVCMFFIGLENAYDEYLDRLCGEIWK